MLLLHGINVRRMLAFNKTAGHARSSLVSHSHVIRLERKPGTTGLAGFMHACPFFLTWLQ